MQEIGVLRAQLDVALARIVRLEASLAEANALAMTDPLTDLPNRRGLNTEGQRMLAHLMRVHHNGASEDISVVYIDIDEFKPINEKYGHDVGDLVLHTVVDSIASNLRQEDLLARVGGDEFVAMLVGSETAVEALTTRIKDGLWISLPGTCALTQIRLSIGCVCFNGRDASSYNKGSEEAHLRASHIFSLDISHDPNLVDIKDILQCLRSMAESQMRVAKHLRGAGR